MLLYHLRRFIAAPLVMAAMLLGAAAAPDYAWAKEPTRRAQSKASAKAKAAAKKKNKRKAVARTKRVKYAAAPRRQAVAARPSLGMLAGLHQTPDPLDLKSSVAFVLDQSSSDVLFAKNAEAVLPIASITKLMTALVVLEARQPLHEVLEISTEDIDTERNSRSRLVVGAQLTRADMLHLALMSSENRAAHALGRYYPGGLRNFVAAMNAKARAIGMHGSQFVDPTGLSDRNRASAGDLARLVTAAYEQPLIREYSTTAEQNFMVGRRMLRYRNTNNLVANPDWDIGLSKTGFITEAGKCLVMQTRIEGKPVVIVLLDSFGKLTRVADAKRIRKWLLSMGQVPGE